MWLVITEIQSDKLLAGYRAPSRHLAAMCHHSQCCLLDARLTAARHIFHRWVWYRVLSLCVHAMHVFDIRASSSPTRLPLCQISFLLSPPHCWTGPWKKSDTQSCSHSITQLIWYGGNRSLSLHNKLCLKVAPWCIPSPIAVNSVLEVEHC